ncbi:MAG TPA: site-specific integrase [Armatimonadota bacterium]|jgi:site-specific recombinase XerD
MIGTDFARHLHTFLTKYLTMQRNVSTNTVKAYRDTFTLLLRYCRDLEGLAIERFTFEQFQPSRITAFLADLEERRHCRVTTRNQRLAALHAFARYLQIEEPTRILQWQHILAIPFKRHERHLPAYLTPDEMQAVLAQPNRTTRYGRRDLVLLSLLYDTGARVQEIADLRIRDVRLAEPAQIRLTGKGRKTRIVPLMRNTVALLTTYLEEHDTGHPTREERPLFLNTRGQPYTRSGITVMVQKYVKAARDQQPTLPEKVTPHTFRHSKAMHMLQAGIPLIIIRDFLGHVDIKTSEIYARVDLDMKRRALEKVHHTVTPPELPAWEDDAALMEWLRSL